MSRSLHMLLLSSLFVSCSADHQPSVDGEPDQTLSDLGPDETSVSCEADCESPEEMCHDNRCVPLGVLCSEHSSCSEDATVCVCDPEGGWMWMAWDLDGDGEFDSGSQMTFDESGRLITRTSDNDYDGQADTIRTWTYNDAGNLLTFQLDVGADGEVEMVDTYVYDDDGNLLIHEEDASGDGVADRREVYTYDEDGNLVTYEYDWSADGIVDSRTIYYYDEDGRVERLEIDGGAGYGVADGVIDRIAAYTFDENGNVLTIGWYLPGMDTPYSERTYIYDEEDNRVGMTEDRDGDGSIDWRCVYDPPCPAPHQECTLSDCKPY